MITCSLILVYRLAMELAIAGFHENIQGYLLTLPNLTCSLLSPEPFIVLFFYNIYVILFFKVMVALYPIQYLSMDHDCVSKMVLMLMLTMWSFEFFMFTIIYGTYCHPVQIYFLKLLYNFKFDEENLNKKPSIVLVHTAITLIPQIIKFIAKTKHRKDKRVHPYTASLIKKKVSFNDIEKGNDSVTTDDNKLVDDRTDRENFNDQLNSDPTNEFQNNLDSENTIVVRNKPKFAVFYVDNSKSIYVSRKYRGRRKIPEPGPSSKTGDELENENVEEKEMEDYIAESFDKVIDLSTNNDNFKLELEMKEAQEAEDNFVKDNETQIKPTSQRSTDIPLVHPQIIKTDSFIWYSIIIAIIICIIFFVKINQLPVNRIGHIGWLIIPPFWIIRTEGIFKFCQRRYFP